MRIILAALNASYIHSNLAIRQLAAWAKREAAAQTQGRESGDPLCIEISEFTINEQADDIARELFLLGGDVYLFSTYIWNINLVDDLCEILAKAAPGVLIGLGGPEVSYDPEAQLRRLPEADFVITGEGERGLSALIAGLPSILDGPAVRSKDALRTRLQDAAPAIPGIVCRSAAKEAGTVYGPQARPLLMGELPFAYEDDLSGEKLANRILYYESSRGCPYSCSYCLSSAEVGVRFKPLEMVLQEIDTFWSQHVRQVKFVDRTFNADRRRARAIWRHIINLAEARLTAHAENGDNEKLSSIPSQPTVRRITGEKAGVLTNFHFEITADLLQDEDIEILNRAAPGLIQLEIGVQSTDDAVLASISRPQDLEDLNDKVRRLAAPGNIHIHLDLIAGLPNEDLATFSRSFDDVYRLEPHAFQLGFLKLLKGTRLRTEADRGDAVYHSRAPYEVIRTRWLSFADLSLLKDVAWVIDHFYNSGSYEASLKHLTGKGAGAFAAYSDLSRWLRRRGCFARRISRDELTVLLHEYMGEDREGRAAVRRDFERQNQAGRAAWDRLCKRYGDLRD